MTVPFQSPTPDLSLKAATISASDLPLADALHPGRALAVITGIEGAAYRPVGAAMVIDASGRRYGSLSSGCIERDVALQAIEAMAEGAPRRLRYGRGSPFLDLTLPCGGGLDITILPHPDLAALGAVQQALARRQDSVLDLGDIVLTVRPDPRLVIFGKGPEPCALARLAEGAGYEVATYSPDPETVEQVPNAHLLTARAWPQDLALDPCTAVALFFHEHDWEPPLLAHALASEAFYVGAQGSLRAQQARQAALAQMGLEEALLARLASPFGLIPSVRDARTLAVSVLADILATARAKDVIR